MSLQAASLLRPLVRSQETLGLVHAAARAALRQKAVAAAVVSSQTRKQILFTGLHAVPLIALLAAVVGVLVVRESAERLPAVGQAEFMGRLLVVVVLRELAPMLVAFVVTARTGAAVATEIALLKVRGEIDGLLGTGVDPLAYLVWPRILGVAVSILLLTVVFNLVAFFAGFGYAAYARPTLQMWSLFDTLLRAMRLGDLGLSFVKSSLMGLSIAAICVEHGLGVEEASTAVPVAALRAVVASFVACIFIELALTFVSSAMTGLGL